jgi:hypothetical protein
MSTDSSILIICGCWQKAQRQQISHHTDNTTIWKIKEKLRKKLKITLTLFTKFY